MNFTYLYKRKTIFYKGCVFDSTVELKFVLMIEETHAWLGNRIDIYYEINFQHHVIKGNLHCYRPDFLIRHLTTHAAELIKIKPDGTTKEMHRISAKTVAKHISRFAYDWQFRIITESQIVLSAGQWLRYQEIIATQNNWRYKPCMNFLQNNTRLSDPGYDQFIRAGG